MKRTISRFFGRILGAFVAGYLVGLVLPYLVLFVVGVVGIVLLIAFALIVLVTLGPTKLDSIQLPEPAILVTMLNFMYGQGWEERIFLTIGRPLGVTLGLLFALWTAYSYLFKSGQQEGEPSPSTA